MLFGRGAADMKGSLAAMVVAAERLLRSILITAFAFLITEGAAQKWHRKGAVGALMARNAAGFIARRRTFQY